MTAPVTNPASFPEAGEAFFINGPAGVLECLADLPDPEQARPGCAIICHPHPQHGGTLRNKVVTIIERSLRELGLATVRFNFRGVGDSAGEFAEGVGEADDLRAVIDWVQAVRPNDQLWLGGFSFGAYVSLKVAPEYDIAQLISIAPPAERYNSDDLSAPGCPWLVVQGDEDEVVSAEAVQAWAQSRVPQPELVMMEGAGHFFHRRLMDLRGLIKNHVQANLP
jgi:alpha/beta superfamily hydrolase